MNGRFIYVFGRDERDALLASGYTLLKSDRDKDVYIFVNKSNQDRALFEKMQCAFSDTLTL